MSNNELFELCKAVYEKTGWDKTEHVYLQGNVEWVHHMTWPDMRFPDDFPLYTSDYLLEKLAGHPHNIELLVLPSNYSAVYQKGIGHKKRFWGDTPAEALLKLTLALHEAGELK